MKKKIPFNIEKAKAGAKVETRNGRPARIVCYDKKPETYPILALVKYKDSEYPIAYAANGRYCPQGVDCEYPHDLMIVEEDGLIGEIYFPFAVMREKNLSINQKFILSVLITYAYHKRDVSMEAMKFFCASSEKRIKKNIYDLLNAGYLSDVSFCGHNITVSFRKPWNTDLIQK